jgi:hypothetical protein
MELGYDITTQGIQRQSLYMSVQAVLLPVFVQIALTLVLMFWMGGARVAAIRGGKATIRDTALGQPNWPPRVAQIGNCYHNQFQAPLLFYAVVILALLTRKADLLLVVLSWLFVAFRIVHAVIHCSTNYVPHRFYAFLAGALVLTVMWVFFAVHILFVSG